MARAPSETRTYETASKAKRKAFDAEYGKMLTRLSRTEIWKRAREKILATEPSVSPLLSPDIPAKSEGEARAGTLGDDAIFTDVFAGGKSQTSRELRQRGDYERTGELRRSRPGKELAVSVKDPLTLLMVPLDPLSIYAESEGDTRRIHGIATEKLATELAATTTHELLHAQRRFRNWGVVPSDGVTLDSTTQRSLDRALKSRHISNLAKGVDEKAGKGYGERLVEEAFFTVTTRPEATSKDFQGSYSGNFDNPQQVSSVSASVPGVFEAVQQHIAAEKQMASDLNNPERLFWHVVRSALQN